MAQLALTIGGAELGAYIGSFFGPIGTVVGGAIGSAVGSAVGSALFPAAGPQPPKLRITDSSYGTFLPLALGQIRVPGQVIWADPAGIQQSSGGGGKGGSSQSSSTATLTFQVAICDCLLAGPLIGVIGMLFDGKHVYSTVAGNAFGDDLPMTIYLGTDTQAPDPVAVALMGANKVSGYPFTAYVSFENLDITQYGRIPNIEFIVITHGGSIPWRVFSYTVEHAGNPFDNQANIYSSEYDGNTLSIGKWNSATFNGSSYTLDTYDLDGTHIAQTLDVTGIPTFASGSGLTFIPLVNSARIAFGVAQAAGSIGVSAWYVNGAKATGQLSIPTGHDNVAVVNPPVLMNENIYVIGGQTTGYVARFPCPSGNPSNANDQRYDFTGTSATAVNNRIIWSDDGNVWVRTGFVDATSPMLWKFDANLTLIDSWVKADLPLTWQTNDNVGDGVIYQGRFLASNSATTMADLWTINTATRDWTYIDSIAFASVSSMVSMGNGLILLTDGVISLNPPPADITVGEALTILNGSTILDTSDYDVTEMTDILPGVLFSDQMSIVSAQQQLLAFAQAGGVEEDFQIKYRKFARDPVAQFVDDDFAWVAEGGEFPDDMQDVMDHEEELPQAVVCTYIDSTADYHLGSQIDQRQSTISTLQTQLKLGIAMTPQKGKAIASAALYDTWEGRHKLTIATYLKWLALSPLDNIIAKDRVLRITDKTDAIDNVVTINARGTDGKIFTQVSLPQSSDGFSPRNPASGSSADLSLVMLDIPLISDSDPVGPYVASSQAATLYKSADNVNYTLVGPIPASPAIGTVTTAPGDFSGNVLDLGNIIGITLTSGTLSSVTNDELLNGANLFACGNGEMLQTRDQSLITPNVYAGSAMLRGRLGTEFATATHLAGETIVQMPVTSVPLALSEFGRLRYYKAVKAGQTLASATAVPFTCNGAALRPYAPVMLGGGTDGSGNVTLTWFRRTRVGGAWPNLGDVPLSETTEAYVIQIWDSAFANVARLINSTTPTCAYSAANQVTDFGSTQQHIYFTVQQVGSYGLGTAAHGVAGGGGSSDTSVSIPIPPYGGSPPMGGGCTLPVTTGTLPWTTGARIISPILGIGDEWVVDFTTGSSVGTGSGSITIAEYGGGPIPRNGVLATSPCGSPLTPSCSVNGSPTVTFPFFGVGTNPMPTYYPSVAALTQYFVSVNPQGTGAMYAMIILP